MMTTSGVWNPWRLVKKTSFSNAPALNGTSPYENYSSRNFTPLADGRVFVDFGGHTVRKYLHDPYNNAWTAASTYPSSAFAPGVGRQFKDDQGCIRSVQGLTVSKYDPATDAWSFTTRLDGINLSYLHQSVTIPGLGALLFGLSNYTTGAALTTVYLFRFSTEQLELRAALPVAKIQPKGTLMADGKVWVGGGYNNLTTLAGLTSAHIYDPDANTWTVAAVMPLGVLNFKVCTVPGGNILLHGGVTEAATATSNDNMYMYYPLTNTWSLALDSSMAGGAGGGLVTLSNGVVMYYSTIGPSVKAYDPDSQQWAGYWKV